MNNKIFKNISLLMAVIIVLILPACGSEDISGKIEDIEEKTDISGSIVEPPSTEEITYKMGDTSGGIYTNDFLKIGCKLDENWTYYNDEQLAELSGVTMENLDEDLAELLEEATESGKIVYDMYAASNDSLANVSVIFENLGVMYSITLDEDKYIDISLENTQRAWEALGGENMIVKKAYIDFAGASHPALIMTGELPEFNVYQTLVCIKQGNYMASITFGSFMEDITGYLAGLFYTID